MAAQIWSAPGSALLSVNAGRMLVLPPGTERETAQQAHALLADDAAITHLIHHPDTAPLIALTTTGGAAALSVRGRADITTLLADGTTRTIADPGAAQSSPRPAHTERLDAAAVHIDLGSTVTCTTLLHNGITTAGAVIVRLAPDDAAPLSDAAEEQITRWLRGAPGSARAPKAAAAHPSPTPHRGPQAAPRRAETDPSANAPGSTAQPTGSRIADAFTRAARDPDNSHRPTDYRGSMQGQDRAATPTPSDAASGGVEGAAHD